MAGNNSPRALMLFFCLFLAFNSVATGFQQMHAIDARSTLALNAGLFGGLFGGSKKENEAPTATTTKTGGSTNVKLEKISRTQNRDWAAETKAIEAAKAPPVIRDLQKQSKPNEFPNLYKGWIPSQGDQIGKQIIASTVAALKAKEKYVEVLFDPVPNLDEVAFGTEWNMKLRKEIVPNLKVPEFAVNRGGPSILEWTNLYWANRLCAGIQSIIGSKKSIVCISVSGEGTTPKGYRPTMAKGVQLMTLQDARKGIYEGDVGAFIIISPCANNHYDDARRLAEKLSVPCIALNSPYSFRYDVGGGKPFLLTYVMKRIPKGWIFRNYPGEFQAVIEGPNYDVFVAKSFGMTQPPLPEISKVSMAVSAEKYGKVGNDRIFQNRL